MHRLLILLVTACSIPSATFHEGDVDAATTGGDAPDARRDAATPGSDTGDAGAVAVCGNGVIELGEDCDGGSCPATCLIPSPPGSVTVRFVATVFAVEDLTHILVPAVELGERTWGRFVYPRNLVDTASDPKLGDYSCANPFGGYARLAVWTFHPGSTNSQVQALDQSGAPDGVGFFTNFPVSEPAIGLLNGLSISLQDSTGTAISSDALPRPPFPALSVWTERAEVRFGGEAGATRWIVVAQLDQLTFEQN
ncbi:MAG: hypothetical protein ABI867_31240 [Kofleriaceae bacterium]